MDQIDIRKIDTTLLLVFLAVMRRRKLTAAAEELGLTQSTISHALGRLRDVFGDDLFLRRPYGVEPTSRALQLEPQVRRIIELLEMALDGGGPFSPHEARGIFRIAMPDHYCALLSAPLLREIASEAPQLRISIRSFVRRGAIEALSAGAIDLSLGYFWNLPKGFRDRPLFTDDHRVVARAGHPLLARGLDLENFLEAEHALVSLGGDLEGVVDHALAKLGRKRKLVVGLPYFLPTLATVAKTDLIATVPTRPATVFAKTFGLDVFKPPVETPTYRASAVWHERNASNELLKWMVAKIEAVLMTSESGA